MTACSGELLTALVDGALSHDERDRVHAHLAGCLACRSEVEALRALKARLSGLGAATPAPPASLVAQLRALAVPPLPALASAGPPAPPTRRDPAAPVGLRRPPARAHRRLRRATALSGVAALGLGAVLLLGGAPEAPAPPAVDPGSDTFVVDFASTTGELPLSEPAGTALTLPPAPARR